jgi:hypothetical protein
MPKISTKEKKIEESKVIENNEENNEETVNTAVPLKKRGRKPKDKIITTETADAKELIQEEETLILFLPLSVNKVNKLKLTYNPNIETLEPNAFNHQDNTNYASIDEKSFNQEQSNIITEQSSFFVNKDEQVEQKTLTKKQKRFLDILVPFQQANRMNKWIETTNICCHWCCESFNDTPIGLPMKNSNGKYYVIGVFCSFNCAAAYNFDMKDSNVWERYNLLNCLYNDTKEDESNKNFEKVDIAPSRLLLQRFGGPLSIDDFRQGFLTNRKYKITYPPMISIIPQVEELNINYGNENLKKFVPIHDEQLKMISKKVNKKDSEKNILELTMGIQVD